MDRAEFVEQYTEIVKRALYCAEKARRESWLALDAEIINEKADGRDIFEYGLRFVTDGVAREFINIILSNLVEQEKDGQKRTLKNIQKEAVLLIQEGINPELLYLILNSFTDIPLNKDKARIIPDREN